MSEKDDLLKTAKDRFKLAMSAWEANRKAWLEDVKFLSGDQWPEEIKRFRSRPGKERPCLVVDKLGQFVRQVVNDGRQNRPSVKVRPVEGGDVDVAEAFQGIIRHIWDKSRGDQAADTALEHAVKGGFGFLRLTTEPVDDETFDQEVCIKRVRNPLAVLLDPNFTEADGSDACYGFVIDEVPKEEFKRRYPKSKFTDWQADAAKYSDGWADGDNVRVCEYFYKVDTSTQLHRLDTGEYIADAEYQKAIAELGADKVPAIEETRTVADCKVKWCRLSGAEILEENEWLGKYIPIIPVFGNEEDIDGKVTYSGLIRKAKDAQRLYNYSRSAFAERVALTPKAPFIAAAEAIADHPEWEDANTGNYSVLRYKAFGEDGQTPMPPPQRQNPSDVPVGFSQDAQMSEHDIQGAMGMYNASLGERSNEKSGKAILARQKEGDVGTFHYQDNQSRAIGYLGVQLIDLIPKVWDSRRAVRLLGEDGKATSAEVDPQQSQPVVKANGVKIYNLNAGKYDVSVSSGPSYTTKRQEAVEAMMQLTQSAPQFLQVAGDIMVRNMDWPGAQEIADRLKKMLPPQLQDDENGEESPEVAAVKAQASQIINQLQDQLQQIQQAAQEAIQERDQLKADHEIKTAEVAVKAYEAETERLQVVSPMTLPELIQAVAQETVKAALQQPNPTELAPEGQEPSEPPDIDDMPMGMPPNQPPQGGFFTPEGNQ